jgi:N-methylhydantoinase B
VFLNGVEVTRFPPIRFRPGDELELRLPGAGGFGSPAEREAGRVRADVEQGYLSTEAARRAYGPEALPRR